MPHMGKNRDYKSTPGHLNPKEQVVPFKRTVDPKGTDPGAAKEVESLVKRKQTLAVFEPTPPKFGNPVKQIGGLMERVKAALGRRTNSTGNAMSPSTMQDKGHAGEITTLTEAERDSLAKKYLGR